MISFIRNKLLKILFILSSLFLIPPTSISAQSTFTHTSRLSLPVTGFATVVVEQKEGVEHKSVLISDYLSSTKVIISEDGQVIESPSYYPYGESINPTSPKVGNNRYYTNQRKVTDDSTLYNYNARYYNPDYSYFIQPDSIEGPARYSYVSGNPIMNSDPSGNVVCTFCKNSIDTSQYPEDPEDIPDVSTKIGVILKRVGVFDTVSLAKQVFDTATGIGYRPEWDSTLSYSNSLNKYVSKDQALSDRFVNDGLGMVGTVNSRNINLRARPSANGIFIARREILTRLVRSSGPSRNPRLNGLLGGWRQDATSITQGSRGVIKIDFENDPDLIEYLEALKAKVTSKRLKLGNTVSRMKLVEEYVRDTIIYDKKAEISIFAKSRGKAPLGSFCSAKRGICLEQALLTHIGGATMGVKSEMMIGELGIGGGHAWVRYVDTITNRIMFTEPANIRGIAGGTTQMRVWKGAKIFDTYRVVRR